MNDCKGLFGRLFGHDFQAHFNTESNGGNFRGVESAAALVKLIEAQKTRTLASVVCRRCGASAP